MIERRFCDTKQWSGLATRYDKHAIIYRAAVLIHTTIAWTKTLSETPRRPVSRTMTAAAMAYPRAPSRG